MTRVKRYRDYSTDRAAAADIAADVVCAGRSDGWTGSSEELGRISEILRPFEIVYVDDMFGAWAQRGKPWQP